MNTAQLLAASQQYIMSTYARFPVVFTRGEGAYLWDSDGRQYLDLVSGLAVCNLGHCHPRLTTALQDQARKLLHVSNLYHIQPQIKLARKLCEISFADKAFFCNSGAEANEGAIKLARRWAWRKYGEGRHKIITFDKSFHGRTMATVTATGQSKFHTGFAPLLGGFAYVPFADTGALEKAADGETAAIMIEPVQAEGGVNPAPPEYLAKVRRLCDERGVLLILDEVQTGMGRTGKWFAYEHYGIKPDIMTLAKGLGGGVAIGALLATDEVARAFGPGSHASTFGGNPLACAAALAVVETIEKEKLLRNCREMGAWLERALRGLQEKYPFIKEVRGRGLIWGIEMERPVAPLVSACLERRLLVISAGEKVLRLLPPLIITRGQLERGVNILDGALGEGG